LSELASLKGRAFGQFSSSKTQRPDSTDPIEIEITDQEDMFGGEHTIDFVQGDIEVKKSGMYLIMAAPQIGQVLTRLNEGDTLNIMMSVENAGEGLGIEAIQPPGEPLVPSVILTILQM
jgi:hypothetical protein